MVDKAIELTTSIGLKNLGALSDRTRQVSNKHREASPSPYAPSGGDILVAANPAIDLGTMLANWLVPVILIGLGMAAISALRSATEVGSHVSVQSVPVPPNLSSRPIPEVQGKALTHPARP